MEFLLGQFHRQAGLPRLEFSLIGSCCHYDDNEALFEDNFVEQDGQEITTYYSETDKPSAARSSSLDLPNHQPATEQLVFPAEATRRKSFSRSPRHDLNQILGNGRTLEDVENDGRSSPPSEYAAESSSRLYSSPQVPAHSLSERQRSRYASTSGERTRLHQISDDDSDISEAR